MVVVLIVWIALALVLGALIGKAIRRADVVEFPDRAERPWWIVTPPTAPREAAAPRPARASPDAGAPRAAAIAPLPLAA